MANLNVQVCFAQGDSANTAYDGCNAIGMQIINVSNVPLATAAARDPIWFNMEDFIPSFTGREDKLKEVSELFFPSADGQNEKVQSIRLVALIGLGGTGKTEFARKFADEFSAKFDKNCVWINAESDQKIQQDFKDLVKRIEPKEVREELERDEIFTMIKKAYLHFGKQKSLFIFDNVEKWADIENGIKKYLPRGLGPDCIKPFVLMTSRNRPEGATGTVNIVELNVLKEQEAIKLIQERLNTKKIQLGELPLQLARLLGCLPLALQQAISYIVQDVDIDISDEPGKALSHSIKEYICTFAAKTKELLGYYNTTMDDDVDEFKTTLVTWRITLKKIDKVDSNSRADWGQL